MRTLPKLTLEQAVPLVMKAALTHPGSPISVVVEGERLPFELVVGVSQFVRTAGAWPPAVQNVPMLRGVPAEATELQMLTVSCCTGREGFLLPVDLAQRLTTLIWGETPHQELPCSISSVRGWAGVLPRQWAARVGN